MNLLLLVRSEIISIIILVFLLVYDYACSKYREDKNRFKWIAFASLGHTIMGLVTEITVNTPSLYGLWNDLFHILFFSFALFFSIEYFRYALSLVLIKEKARIFNLLAIGLSLISIVVMLLSPIYYLEGNGTYYSAGLGPTMCYALGFSLLLLADFVIIKYRKYINNHIVYVLVPISLLAIGLEIVQIFIPEFLFTGCSLTVLSVGIFFAIENPIGKFRNRAFVDFDTQTWSRNCYEYDMVNVIPNIIKESELTYVLADLNGLKRINDTYGHIEGDKAIEITANSLKRALKNAYKIYRVGGDEFAILYVNIPIVIIKSEILRAQTYTLRESKDLPYSVVISAGYAVHRGDDLKQTIHTADIMMYDQKREYYQSRENDRRNR